MKRLPIIGERCDSCGGWITRACPCFGQPGASIEEHARWAAKVDRATKRGKPTEFKPPPRRAG